MSIPEYAGIGTGALTLLGLLVTGAVAIIRSRDRTKRAQIEASSQAGDREERFIDRMAKRLDALEERDIEKDKRLNQCEDRHDECQEDNAALRSMLFRLHNVGDVTGKHLIDEAYAEVRKSKRSIPPPARRSSDDE